MKELIERLGTDLLVAYKDADRSLEDFMAELSSESEILGA